MRMRSAETAARGDPRLDGARIDDSSSAPAGSERSVPASSRWRAAGPRRRFVRHVLSRQVHDQRAPRWTLRSCAPRQIARMGTRRSSAASRIGHSIASRSRSISQTPIESSAHSGLDRRRRHRSGRARRMRARAHPVRSRAGNQKTSAAARARRQRGSRRTRNCRSSAALSVGQGDAERLSRSHLARI